MKTNYSPIENEELPSDIDQLKNLLSLRTEQYNTVVGELQKLSAELSWLKRQIFGTKSERFVPNESQLGLNLEVSPAPAPQITTETITYERTKETASEKEKKEGHGRGNMPTHLPIEDCVIEPSEDVTKLERIGEDVSWEYDYTPGKFIIRRTIRPKYVRREEAGDTVFIAPLPARPIEKGNASAGLMARVVIDKYLYHLPLDRQRRRFHTEYAVDIAESTLCDMVRHAAFWIEPLYQMEKEKIITASYVQADETPLLVLIKNKKGKAHTGYYWVYYDPVLRLVIFEYRMSRGRDGPSTLLKDFKGILQVDGYGGYNEVLSREGMTRAACMAHVRRKFEAAKDTDPVRAEYALTAIGKWFDIERQAKQAKMTFEQCLDMRQQLINPSMTQFHEWLKKECLNVLPKSLMGNAIAYALNQWVGFTAYQSDGRVELSNNLVENAIRPVAVGRKNYLFAGSHEAAQRAAMIYSLIATAHWHGHDPFAYFKDILTKLPAAKNTDLSSFLPQNWKNPKNS